MSTEIRLPLLALTLYLAVLPSGLADEPAHATLRWMSCAKLTATRRPATASAALPVVDVPVDCMTDEGPLELWRHSLGHGGIIRYPCQTGSCEAPQS